MLVLFSFIGLGEALSYLTVIMLITNSVDSSRLGMVHGVAATFAAAARAIAPSLAGTLWELGVSLHMPWLVFVSISAISVIAVLFSFKMNA
jgi:hypothetical protein